MRGLKELRVKESDRLAGTAAMLRINGVKVDIDGDDLIVAGQGPRAGRRPRRHPHGSSPRHVGVGHGPGERAAGEDRRRKLHRHKLSRFRRIDARAGGGSGVARPRAVVLRSGAPEHQHRIQAAERERARHGVLDRRVARGVGYIIEIALRDRTLRNSRSAGWSGDAAPAPWRQAPARRPRPGCGRAPPCWKKPPAARRCRRTPCAKRPFRPCR